MKTTFTLILICIFLSRSISAGQAQDSIRILPQLVEELLQNNPDLRSQHHRWEATTVRISSQGALPEPVLGLGLMNLPVDNFSFNQEPMTGKQISLMQMFPFPGKQGLRQDVARNQADFEWQQYLDLQNRLTRDLKTFYYQLRYIDQSLETNHENSLLLTQFRQIAETRYRVGKGLQQDVLKSQVELAKLSDDRLNLEQQRDALQARINSLLNRPVDMILETTPDSGEVEISCSLEVLKNLAEEYSPALQSSRVMIDQSRHQLASARKEYLPDFSLEIAYTQREVLASGEGGVDFLSGMMNVTLPLYFWKKQNKLVQEQQLNERSVLEKDLDLRQKLYADLQTALSAAEKNRRRLTLFRNGIIPQARQALQSTLSAYQVNKVDFLTLIDSQMTLFEYQLEYYRVRSDYYQNLAELDALVGVELQKIVRENN